MSREGMPVHPGCGRGEYVTRQTSGLPFYCCLCREPFDLAAGAYERPTVTPMGRLADMKTSALIRLAADMLNMTAPVAAELRGRAELLERFAADLAATNKCLGALEAIGEGGASCR